MLLGPDPNGTGGTCNPESGPNDQFCSNNKAIGCAVDGDCPGGTCATVTRPCNGQTDANGMLTGNIVRTGTAVAPNGSGLSTSTLAATFCIPATTSSAVNAAGGLPGPGALLLPTQSQLAQ